MAKMTDKQAIKDHNELKVTMLRIDRKLMARAALVSLLLVLGGCGGGIYYSEGFDDHPLVDQPPTASIAANTTVTAPGSTLRLIAAAADDFGVQGVDFYIRDARGDILLAHLNGAPWEIITTVPNNAVGVVTYVVRAIDDIGQESAPAVVNIAVQGF
jgi:hypothetical protein